MYIMKNIRAIIFSFRLMISAEKVKAVHSDITVIVE